MIKYIFKFYYFRNVIALAGFGSNSVCVVLILIQCLWFQIQSHLILLFPFIFRHLFPFVIFSSWLLILSIQTPAHRHSVLFPDQLSKSSPWIVTQLHVMANGIVLEGDPYIPRQPLQMQQKVPPQWKREILN